MNQRQTFLLRSETLAALFLVGVVAVFAVSFGAFNRSFSRFVPVTLTSDRSGLVMEPNAKVKMRGIQVGHVTTVSNGSSATTLRLDIDPGQIQFIPANVEARIQSTTVFGAKYVELLYPQNPVSQRLASGAVLRSQNVATEVNTVFQNLVDLIEQVDPAKLNAVLSALAQGVRGQGERMSEAITSANEVVSALNARSDTLREDWRSLRRASNTYNAAAQHILDTLSAFSTTSATVTEYARELDALLLSVVGMSQSGIALLGPTKDNLVKSVNQLQPTADLLLKYNPQLTCTLVGSQLALDSGFQDIAGGRNGKSLVLDAQLLFGDDPYRYPDNLPINAAKGGPGGKPGCGSLPDVAQNWPVRYLEVNTGWGTGLDVR
ncbi:MAG TPA: MCE family protein, partial [Mycobacterium sp.]|nr:MCE family protein [Mycobacterium sp.]